MSDEDFENIESSVESLPEQEGRESINPIYTTSLPSNLRNQVIERKLWVLQTIHIYPNGMMFIKETQSWFDKNQQAVKKKVKKKLEVKKAEIGQEECY